MLYIKKNKCLKWYKKKLPCKRNNKSCCDTGLIGFSWCHLNSPKQSSKKQWRESYKMTNVKRAWIIAHPGSIDSLIWRCFVFFFSPKNNTFFKAISSEIKKNKKTVLRSNVFLHNESQRDLLVSEMDLDNGDASSIIHTVQFYLCFLRNKTHYVQ